MARDITRDPATNTNFTTLSHVCLLVYDNSHGPKTIRRVGFGLEDTFRPLIQNTEDAHKGSGPGNLSAAPCVYKDVTCVRPEQMQRHELSVNVPCYNIQPCPRENEHQPRMGTSTTANLVPPKVLVEYDNFPPNKTIGPEMKVVIPPIPNHNLSRSSPKDNARHMQFVNTGSRQWVSHYSPIRAPEADFTDSDSDWESEAMVALGGML